MSKGLGMKSCTWSGRNPVRLRNSASCDHRVQVAAGMAGDEVRDQVLLLAGRGGGLAELRGRTRRSRRSPGFFISRQHVRVGMLRARPSNARPRDAAASSRMYSGLRRARSMRMPEATSTFLMPSCLRASRIKSISGPWSVPSSLQIVGWTQLSRRHLPADLGPAAIHAIHVGRRPADVADHALELRDLRASRRISASTDSRLRLWMTRPSWAVIEQKVQPPKQPRMIWIESLTTSKAGIFCSP